MGKKEMQPQDLTKVYSKEALPYLVTRDRVKQAIPKLSPDSHKGQNGRLLIIASSPLFHGSGMLATQAAAEVEAVFGMRTNDWLYYCSTAENIEHMKSRYDAFLGITRDMAEEYLTNADVAVVGPGLMRESQNNFKETEHEPEATRKLTELVLKSGKKAVLDAGSIQIINPDELKGHKNVIITPHLGELKKLFGVDRSLFQTHHTSTFAEISEIAKRLQDLSRTYDATILLKGPIDIAVNRHHWQFSPGGDPSLTRGGTGDVLAGVIGALYHRTDDPLMAAAAGSYLVKRTGEYLAKTYQGIFDATDVSEHVGKIHEALRHETAEALKE